MSTYVETILKCTRSDEVLCVLEVFLRDFVESGFSSQIPSALFPVRICSPAEVKTWSTRVRIAVDQHANGTNFDRDTLNFLGTVLDAASRRIELLAVMITPHSTNARVFQ